MAVNFGEEKLVCLMVLDDSFAHKLSCTAGPAFWRGFILENRTTHRIRALMRFKYENEERSWFETNPSEEREREAEIARLRCGIEDVLKIGLAVWGFETAEIETAIHCFYPPDDQGDPLKTFIWLEQQGLIEFTVERDGIGS